jgi:hypothetical protein
MYFTVLHVDPHVWRCFIYLRIMNVVTLSLTPLKSKPKRKRPKAPALKIWICKGSLKIKILKTGTVVLVCDHLYSSRNVLMCQRIVMPPVSKTYPGEAHSKKFWNSVDFCQTARRHIPESRNLHRHGREYHKNHVILISPSPSFIFDICNSFSTFLYLSWLQTLSFQGLLVIMYNIQNCSISSFQFTQKLHRLHHSSMHVQFPYLCSHMPIIKNY